MKIEEILSNSNFFNGFSKTSCEKIAEIGCKKIIKKKEHLFFEGDSGHSFFLLLSGKIQLSKATAEGKEVVIKVVMPGEMFAEVILFEDNIYPVTASALNNSELFVIEKKKFHDLLDYKKFRDDFISMLIRKQRYLAEKIKSLTIHDVEERFFNFINENYNDKNFVALGMSKKNLAAAIGTTPETLSRLILRLSKQGRIKTNGKEISIIK